jgi:hypothetical protein
MWKTKTQKKIALIKRVIHNPRSSASQSGTIRSLTSVLVLFTYSTLLPSMHPYSRFIQIGFCSLIPLPCRFPQAKHLMSVASSIRITRISTPNAYHLEIHPRPSQRRPNPCQLFSSGRLGRHSHGKKHAQLPPTAQIFSRHWKNDFISGPRICLWHSIPSTSIIACPRTSNPHPIRNLCRKTLSTVIWSGNSSLISTSHWGKESTLWYP